MCGIAGIIGKGRVDPVALELMTGVQSHRGPDSAGRWFSEDGRVGFGHRRLWILDLSPQGAQPMADAGGDLVLNYNGEIYNYLEVMSELKARGSVFRSRSDTEVILEAYKHWGEACVERFNGMFAFALYDRRTRKLFCARDRFGEKPFLFVARPDFFAFASEYKALLSLSEVSSDYDELPVLRFLHNSSGGLDDGRQTVFRDVRQLLPGEALTLDVDALEWGVRRYWRIEADPESARLSEADAVEHFRELLVDSVRIRMRSDVTVGSCLSGGLDSSAIVCIARGLLGQGRPYHVFTGRFPGTEADEWVYAEQVVKRADVDSHVTEPTPARFMQDLEAFVWHNELPVGSTSQFAQWCVFKLAKEHGVTVLLDGQGGDELLGGYEQYFIPYLESLRELGETARADEELAQIRERYPLALLPPGREWLTQLPLRVRRWAATVSGRGSNILFGLDPAVAVQVERKNRRVREAHFNSLASDLSQQTFRTTLPTLLRYGDRNSMAHSREVRLPFCDHRLARLAFSLPPWYLMGGAQTKRLLRESMRGILPEAIRTRWNKQGFRPPQPLWFRDGLLDHAEAVLSDGSFKADPVWNFPWWSQVLRRIRKGEGHLAWLLWQPLIKELWQKHFVERIRRQPKAPALAAEE